MQKAGCEFEDGDIEWGFLKFGKETDNKFGKPSKTYCKNRSDMILYN